MAISTGPSRARLRSWLLSDDRAKRIQGPHHEPAADDTHTHPWWQVMPDRRRPSASGVTS